MSFCSIFTFGRPFYQEKSKCFIYRKIICMLCLFATTYAQKPTNGILISEISQIYRLLFSKNIFFEISNFKTIFVEDS